MNWSIMPGLLSPCDACAVGKARQWNLPKDPELLSPCEACAVGKARQQNLPKDPEKPVDDGKFRF